MKLLDTSPGQEDEYFLDICDLVNAGVEGNRIAHFDRNRSITLNILAGDKAIRNSDFIRALGYCRTAKSLLPSDHWSSMYDPSLRLYLSLSKSLYANGQVDLAESTLRELIGNSRDPLDTLGELLSDCWCRNYLRGLIRRALRCTPSTSLYAAHKPTERGSISRLHEAAGAAGRRRA